MRFFKQKTGSEEHISPENPPTKIPEDPIFNEFSVVLEPLVKLREDAKARLVKPKRGRPQKFKLKQGLS